MTEAYSDHLANIHAKQTISAELLHDILREVSPAPVRSMQRIIAGEVNEVYDISFADGMHVIVRISRDDRHFGQEQWAIRECSLRGVPVPDVLGVWQRSTQEHALHICVQRAIEGVLLSDANLPQEVAHRVVAQAGELLARIHTIPVNGFGYIDGTGSGAFATQDEEIDAFVQMEAEFQALASQIDVRSRDMERALQVIVAGERMARTTTPCLTHNDFCAKHLLVAHGAISGIIDFGEVAGSEPLSDFVRWSYYDAARLPWEWLQEGYTDSRVFDDPFTYRLQVKRLAFSLWVMRWYALNGYAQGVAAARATFLRDLGALEYDAHAS